MKLAPHMTFAPSSLVRVRIMLRARVTVNLNPNPNLYPSLNLHQNFRQNSANDHPIIPPQYFFVLGADALRGPRPCNAEDDTTTYDKWIPNWICEDTRLGPCAFVLDLFTHRACWSKKVSHRTSANLCLQSTGRTGFKCLRSFGSAHIQKKTA